MRVGGICWLGARRHVDALWRNAHGAGDEGARAHDVEVGHAWDKGCGAVRWDVHLESRG